MNPESLTLTTATAGATAILATYSFAIEWFFRRNSRLDRRLKEEFHADGLQNDQDLSIFKQLSEDDGAAQRSLVARLHQFVDQSGTPISVSRLLETCGACALLGAFLAFVFGPHWLTCLPAAAIGAVLPFFVLHIKRKQRIEKMATQLPESFELMSRAVRAGQTIPAAFRLVAEEGKPPISSEFKHCCDQQDLGLPLDVTLHDMARRNGVMELQMFVVALLVQRQTGGSPVELLNNLSGMIRKRMRMKSKVKALTGEGRLQAIVLSILPVVAFAAIYVLKPDYAQVLLNRPAILLSTIASAGLGTLWIRKIVNFDY